MNFSESYMGCLSVILLGLVISSNQVIVRSHGRLMEPPARNSMWRFGYPNPINFNDNELFCGGAAVMAKNGGECGVCGDDYAAKKPRPHEIGGLYGNRIIGRKYTSGEIIQVTIELTANHMGYFEFKICPVRNSRVEVTQPCLDRSPVLFVNDDGSLSDKHNITHESKSETFNLKLQLPKGMPPCKQCVLQWTYRTGNSWGICDNGSEAIGCGEQEKFVNCADISVFDAVSPDIKRLSTTQSNELKSTNTLYYKDFSIAGNPMKPLVVKSQVCVGVGKLHIPGIDSWCQVNCMKYPPMCPHNVCRCVQDCKAVGTFQNSLGADQYCLDNCNVYPPKNCSPDKCLCI